VSSASVGPPPVAMNSRTAKMRKIRTAELPFTAAV
jgi:hypothetical protein